MYECWIEIKYMSDMGLSFYSILGKGAVFFMGKKRIVKREKNQVSKMENKVTFIEAYDYFLNAKKTEGMRVKTIKSYKEHFNFFIRWLEQQEDEIKHIDEVDTALIRKYIVYMKEEHLNRKTKEIGLTPLTINARIRFLKNYYNLLNKEGLVKTDVLDQIKLLRTDETQFEPLTDEEMSILLKTPDRKYYPQNRDYVIMMLLYDSGMRISEAVNLELSELDFQAKRIILPASKIKTRKPKVIPLSFHVIKLLNELVKENENYFGDVEYVFLTWTGEKMAEDTFRRNLNRYVKKTGIKKNFTCHDFRRQFCTEFLEAGGSLFALQTIVGHSQISTTRKYVRFNEQMIKNQHEQFSPVVKLRNRAKNSDIRRNNK